MDKGVRILIGVPSIREDEKFLASLSSLIASMKGKYQVSLIVEKWSDLAPAQNRITKYFLDNDFDYLLFLDDDHAGHTVEMVDDLISANALMATMQTHVRHYPYPIALFKRYDRVQFRSHLQEKGYSTVDLTGFPMTLLKRELFRYLDQPYFQSRNDGTPFATDKLFCERLEKIGIKPVGCYNYCLDHAGITRENVMDWREKNSKSWIDKFRLMRVVKNKE